MQKQKPGAAIHRRKRTGSHHKQGKHYLKVYWPYVPIALIVAVGLFIGNWQPQTKNGVLAYATEMNINTLLSATNQQRSTNNKKPLELNSKLNDAAQAKANDMTARNYWSHATPDGNDPWVFVQGAGYEYQKAGENLAYGFNSSKDTIVAWMNSASHRENLLDVDYTEVGFGFANAKNYTGEGPETVVVAMYGTPLGTPLSNITSQPSAITSTTPLRSEPQTLAVSRIHTLTNGQLPWATFALGILSGSLLLFVLLKHTKALHRLVREGEWYVKHHPWMDVAMVTIVMVGYVLLQSDGVIR